MTIDVAAVTRSFNYGGRTLPDPSPELSLEGVKQFYANIYPELVNALIDGGEFDGDTVVYTFQRAIGDKGM